MQIELYILLSGDRKLTLLRILTLTSLVYDEPFQRYEIPMKIVSPEISKTVDSLHNDVIIKKILNFYIVPKTPLYQTPGIFDLENGEKMKHPTRYPVADL